MSSNRCRRNAGRGFKIRSLPFVLLLVIPGLALPGLSEVEAEERPILAIFPFIIEKTEDPTRGAVCLVCKAIHRSGEVAPGASRALTQALYSKMEALGAFNIFPLEKVQGALSGEERTRFEADPVHSWIKAGKELGADFLMVGLVFRFEERVGSAIGVERPASVAFDLHLYRSKDGVRVWDGNFDETQKALFDNLFQAGTFFREGAKWITAEGLAGVGMDKLLKSFPAVKELEEKP